MLDKTHTNTGLGRVYGSTTDFTPARRGGGAIMFPVTRGWSDHDKKCTVDRLVSTETNKTHDES